MRTSQGRTWLKEIFEDAAIFLVAIVAVLGLFGILVFRPDWSLVALRVVQILASLGHTR
jgi:hypothetical protein